MTQQAARELARQAWRMVYQEGLTQRRAADRLDVDQSTVSRQLKQLEAELAQEFKEEVEGFRARQTMILEHVAQQALAAWDRSTRTPPFPRREGGRGVGRPDDDPDLRVGDPRFLSLVIRANREFGRLWGLTYATPSTSAHAASPGAAAASTLSTPPPATTPFNSTSASPDPARITAPAPESSPVDARPCSPDAELPIQPPAPPTNAEPVLMHASCLSDANPAPGHPAPPSGGSPSADPAPMRASCSADANPPAGRATPTAGDPHLWTTLMMQAPCSGDARLSSSGATPLTHSPSTPTSARTLSASEAVSTSRACPAPPPALPPLDPTYSRRRHPRDAHLLLT